MCKNHNVAFTLETDAKSVETAVARAMRAEAAVLATGAAGGADSTAIASLKAYFQTPGFWQNLLAG